MEIYKQKGKFWLPESSDHQVDGEFELIEESHGRLILFDVIDVIDDFSLIKHNGDTLVWETDIVKLNKKLLNKK